jgi:lysozyme C
MTNMRWASAMALAMVTLVLSGCAADASDGSDDDENDEEAVGQIDEKLLAGRRIPEREVASILRNAGFPESVVPEMVCTAKHESSFYERASNRNRNGSTDRGLFQVNSIHLGLGGCPARGNANALYTASTNAKCAYAIYKAQGLNAWYGYKAHRTECNNYRLP